jgi:hypothetical protein
MEQAWYEIQIKGHLSGSWSDWFSGMEVMNLDGGEALIRGPLPDQTALHGVLARVHALNLTLLGLRRVSIEGAGTLQGVAEEGHDRT